MGITCGSFRPHYFSTTLQKRVGRSDQLRRRTSGPVRELFIANAGYWIDEFHLDGLRLDATQQIFDASEKYIVAEIAERGAGSGQGARHLHRG